MPAGASSKREREYAELQRRFKQEHRYPGREEEVAARIVNKAAQSVRRNRWGKAEGEGGEVRG